MIEYDIEPSDGVPEECWDENDKPECKQYDYLKETEDDWDEYGNYIGKRPKNRALTMRESIPECFDENDNFLEEKCGKITMVENEDGLINYFIGKEIDNIIDKFENVSEDFIDESENTIDEGEWIIDEDELTMAEGVWEVKEEIDRIDKDIKDWVIDHPANDVEGDDGLTWDIKTEVVGDLDGDDGLTPEVSTVVIKEGKDSVEGDDGLTPEVETDISGESGGGNSNVVDGNEMASGTNTDDTVTTVEGEDIITNQIDP